ncbi:MAG: NERD domain-containing protein [Lewinellaceae bacterium]|nr:NERD domain-containing protein [Lewinellaceae bacterium]
MSRMIPDTIPSDASTGEKLVFSLLKNDKNCKGLIVVHSLFIAGHLTAISGEIDFLVLAPGKGIFALEVKHGRVARKEGVWEFTNRAGKTSSSVRGPFRQASDAMHSLRKILQEKSAGNSKIEGLVKNVLFGYGVMFTSLDEFYDYGTEAESWMVFTRQGLNIPISDYIDSLSIGFHEKMCRKSWYDVNKAMPSRAECESILSLIRGDFSYQYSAINRLFDTEEVIERYTKQQFHVLDITKYNNRCLISGQAGTGKTLIATELFRRSVENEKRVGFFCYNRLLGQKIEDNARKLVPGHSVAFHVAGNLHKYMASVSGLLIPENAGHQFFEETLPWNFILSFEEKHLEKFDVLIIDEAQDLITENYLEVFDMILKDGIADGNWVFFGDFSNQAIYLNDPGKSLNYISARASFTRLPPLSVNCRNTKKIASHISLFTGIDMLEFPDMAPEGDKVESFFPSSTSLMAAKIEDIVKDILEEGIPLQHVIILSPIRLENSCVSRSPFLTGLIGEKALSYHTIQAFKGLESSFIILTDLEELDTRGAERLLYVGMSRAKIKLFIVLAKALTEEKDKLYRRNMNKIL